MLRILAIIAPSIAASMSASSNTMNGALPPSSIAGLRMLSAASCSSLRPTSVEPVNDTTRTRGSCSIALTTGPERRDGMHVDDAGRNAGLLEQRHQRQHGERRFARRLQHHRAAGRERGADLARRHRGGEIPRRHQHGDAGRLVLHHHARAGGGRVVELADVAHRFLGVPAEEFGRVEHLALGIRERLAVLDGDQLGEALGVAHDQLERLAQDLGALARLARRPALERALRGVDRGLGVVDARARRPRRSCSRSPDRSRRSARRRKPCAICRRSTGRSARWRGGCRTWPCQVLSFAAIASPSRRSGRPSAARRLPARRRRAAECAAS